MITKEQAKALDGATPGPWLADGDPQNRILWSPNGNRVCFMAHSSGLDDARDIATSNLAAAAPDLLAAVIALHERVDQSLVLLRLVETRDGKLFPDQWMRLHRFLKETTHD